MTERADLSGSLSHESMAPVPAIAAVQTKSSGDKDSKSLRRPAPAKQDSGEELEAGSDPSLHRIDSLA